jgi:hypothetical protein
VTGIVAAVALVCMMVPLSIQLATQGRIPVYVQEHQVRFCWLGTCAGAVVGFVLVPLAVLAIYLCWVLITITKIVLKAKMVSADRRAAGARAGAGAEAAAGAGAEQQQE